MKHPITTLIISLFLVAACAQSTDPWYYGHWTLEDGHELLVEEKGFRDCEAGKYLYDQLMPLGYDIFDIGEGIQLLASEQGEGGAFPVALMDTQHKKMYRCPESVDYYQRFANDRYMMTLNEFDDLSKEALRTLDLSSLEQWKKVKVDKLEMVPFVPSEYPELLGEWKDDLGRALLFAEDGVRYKAYYLPDGVKVKAVDCLPPFPNAKVEHNKTRKMATLCTISPDNAFYTTSRFRIVDSKSIEGFSKVSDRKLDEALYGTTLKKAEAFTGIWYRSDGSTISFGNTANEVLSREGFMIDGKGRYLSYEKIYVKKGNRLTEYEIDYTGEVYVTGRLSATPPKQSRSDESRSSSSYGTSSSGGSSSSYKSSSEPAPFRTAGDVLSALCRTTFSNSSGRIRFTREGMYAGNMLATGAISVLSFDEVSAKISCTNVYTGATQVFTFVQGMLVKEIHTGEVFLDDNPR